jgi:hypothetical protein
MNDYRLHAITKNRQKQLREIRNNELLLLARLEAELNTIRTEMKAQKYELSNTGVSYHLTRIA